MLAFNTKNSILMFALFIICSALMTAIGLAGYSPAFMSVLWLLVITVFVVALGNNCLRSKNDAILFVAGYLARILRVFITQRYNIWADEPILTSDAAGFWKVASEYYEGIFARRYTSYPYVLNFEFHLFGPNIFCCLLVNVALAMGMIVLVFQMLDKFKISGNIRLIVSAIVCLLPYGIIVSTSLLREALYFFFLTASFSSFYSYLTTGRKSQFYLSILSVMVVLVFHIGYFPVALVYFVVSFIADKPKTGRQWLSRIGEIIISIAFIAIISSFNSTSYITGGSGNGIAGIIEKLTGTEEDFVNSGGSVYLRGMNITSFRTLILYTPLKWFFYMTSPLPMNWRGFSDIAAFFADGLIQFFFIWSYIRKKKYITSLEFGNEGPLSHIKTLYKVGFWAVISASIVFALGTGNAGTAIRHRDVMIGIETVILGISHNRWDIVLNNAKEYQTESFVS